MHIHPIQQLNPIDYWIKLNIERTQIGQTSKNITQEYFSTLRKCPLAILQDEIIKMSYWAKMNYVMQMFWQHQHKMGRWRWIVFREFSRKFKITIKTYTNMDFDIPEFLDITMNPHQPGWTDMFNTSLGFQACATIPNRIYTFLWSIILCT